MQLFLINLPDEIIIDEIKSLVNKGRYSKAVVTTLSKGKFLKEIAEQDLPHIDADLILTENHARFDLI